MSKELFSQEDLSRFNNESDIADYIYEIIFREFYKSGKTEVTDQLIELLKDNSDYNEYIIKAFVAYLEDKHEKDRYADPLNLVKEGWIYEANRLFFHPRGAALTVQGVDFKHLDNDREVNIVGIAMTDDEDGFVYGKSENEDLTNLRKEKKSIIEFKTEKIIKNRIEKFGSEIEPVEGYELED